MAFFIDILYRVLKDQREIQDIVICCFFCNVSKGFHQRALVLKIGISSHYLRQETIQFPRGFSGEVFILHGKSQDLYAFSCHYLNNIFFIDSELK